MAEIQSNIQVNIDTTAALANLKDLQRQLSNFNASFAKSSTAAVRAQAEFSNNLVNSINATGKFAAGIQTIQSSTERFTQSLEKNKFSTREYFRYAAGSTKAFSKMFSSEFNTIQKVAEERVKDLQTQYISMGRDANGALKSIAVRPLSLDMDDLATKVAITSQKQQIFGQLLKQGSTNLLNFGKNTQWAGRQLMVGFTIPLTIFGSKAAQVFMDLEMQAIRFKRVYGEMFTTQGETTKALNEVRKLAEEFTKYGVAVVDTMKMAADAAAQGKQGADLMAQVAEATRLAVLGQVEQQQALETTMSLQNAFGYSADQLAGKINFLNAVENQTVVGIEDLTIAIPKAGPVVKQLGGDVEDLAFFLTAMKEGGINASEGANALKSGLASLINPTEKASAMLKEMGVDIQGIVESNKGDIKGTVIGFAQALDRLAPLERARAIEQLFGKFQFARLSTLFQNVTKDGNQAARTLDLTTKSVEELAIMSERELGAVENATGTKFKKAMEDLKVSIAPIGEQFLKAVTPIAEFFSKILNWFNGLSDGVKSGISKLVLIIGVVGPVVLMTFGLLANALANIIKLFGAVRNGFLGLGKNSDQLAFQTKYMSSEQVEAATIAASLDQAHSKLIQTFTVEKTAVAQLAEVYRQAAMAAGRLQGANPGFFMPRPMGGRGPIPPQPPGMRLAKGIVSVPGPKGAGDIVPAMLSPGEAIIPAEQNQKYAPLIQGIIADNIPGFEQGILNVSGTRRDPAVSIPGGFEQSHFGGARDVSRSVLEGMLAGNQAALDKIANLIGETFRVYDNRIVELSHELNSELSGSQLGADGSPNKSASIVTARRDLIDRKNVVHAPLITKMKEAGATVQEQDDAIEALTTEIEAGFARLGDATRITSEEIDRILNSAYDNVSRSNKKVNEAYQRMQRVGSVLDRSAREGRGQRISLPGEESYRNEREQNVATMEEVSKRRGTVQPYSTVGQVKVTSGLADSINELRKQRGEIELTKTQIQQAFKLLDDDVKIRLAKLKGNAVEFAREFAKALDRSSDAVSASGVKLGQSATQGIDKGAQTASPSRKTRKTGEDIGAGLELGMASKIDDVARGGQRLANSAVLGVENGVRVDLDKRTRTRSGAAGGLTPAPKADLPQYTRDGIRIVPVGTTAPSVADDKDKQFRDAQKQQRKTILARTNGVLFGMSTLSSVLGMMGNGIAEKAAPFLVAMNVATMAMQMIQGPWSALAVAVVAVVGGMYYLHKKAQQQAEAQSKYIDSISATSQRISEVGKITGKVGASEIMERRRQGQVSNRFTTGFNRAGQQFGTSFLESDVGKNILESFQQSLKTNGQAAIKQLGTQLAIYVSQGLMDSEQAESIARAIGVSMSDMTITSKIVGDLRGLIGPGGTDLLKDPLEVRVNIIASSVATTKELEAAAKSTVSGSTQRGGSFQASYTVFDEKLLAATAASNVQNLETVQQQIDSQNKMYDDQIASLRRDKEKTKDKKQQLAIENQINDLIAKRKEDEATLRNQGRQILQDQVRLFKEARAARDDSAFQQSIKEQVKTRFKDNPFTDPLLEATRELGEGGKKELEVMINTVVGSGIATPQAMVNMINMFGKDTKGLEQTFTTLFETQDPGKAQELITIFNALGGREGSNKKVLATIMTKISSKEGAGKFDQRLNALQLLMQMDGKEINVGAMLETEDGLAKLDAMVVDFEKIEQIDTPITKKVVTDLEGNLGLEKGDLKPLIDDWEEFGSLPDEIKKTAIQTYISIFRTVGDEERAAYVQKKVAESGGSLRNAEVVGAKAQAASTAEIAFDLFEPIFKALGIDPKGGKGGKGKKGGDRKATMFDDILKKLKLVQQASVNALGGFKELERVMNPKLKKGSAFMAFDGIVNQLSRKNISTDFIEMVEGLSPEELQNKFGQFLNITKNGIVKLKQDAQDLNRALAAVAAGDIVANNAKEMKKLEDRTAAVNILRARAVDYATAMAITESNSIALAIKNGELTNEQLTELVNSQRQRNKLEEEYQKIITVKQQDAVTGQKMANEQMLEFLELQNAIAENQFIVQKTEIEIAAKRNGYALELINYEEELVNNVYNKQIEKLDEIQKRHEEINRLNEQRFSITEAIARGDMAAAARAIQSVRQQEAQNQLERKRKTIEEQRKKTLEGITADGKTRKQIEEENAKNAANLAAINLEIVTKQIKYAQDFTKAIGRTPEELQAYNNIAAKMAEIGGFKLDDQGVLKAIQDAVSGNPTALLSSVQKQIDKTIQTLFGGTVAEKQIRASKEDEYKTAYGKYQAGIGPMPKPEDFGLPSNYGQALDTTPIGFNTTATTANTVALEENTKAIQGGSITAPAPNKKTKDKPDVEDSKDSKGGKSGKSGKGGKSDPSFKPQNPRQADNKKQYVVTPDGAWREVPPKSKTPVIPKQAVDALGDEARRFPTVSGGAIDITVRPNPDDVAATVARINHEEMLAREEQKRQEEARAAAQEQLRAAKQQEAAAARYEDANNRLSPKLAEIVGIYQSTMARLNLDALNRSKEQDTKDVQDILNKKAKENALEAIQQEKKQDGEQKNLEAKREEARKALAEDKQFVVPAILAEQGLNIARGVLAEEKKVDGQQKNLAAGRESVQQAIAEDKKTVVPNIMSWLGLNNALGVIAQEKKADGQKKNEQENLTKRTEALKADREATKESERQQAALRAQEALRKEKQNEAEAKRLADQKEAATRALAQDKGIASATAAALRAQQTQEAIARAKQEDAAKLRAKNNVMEPLNRAEANAKSDWNSKYGPLAGISPAYRSMGGIVPKYFASGGLNRGTDTVPAMLTPGEFVLKKSAVDKFGIPILNKINNLGDFPFIPKINEVMPKFTRQVEPYPGMKPYDPGMKTYGNSVYNYSVSVNVSNTNANPNDIARVVINQIKQIDSQRIRSNR